MSHQPDNVFAGTQVVSLVEVRGTNNSLVHPRGAVGVVALKANPNILECLYSPMVEKITPVGAELVAARQGFLSQMIFQTFNGYAMSQFKKIEQDIRNHGGVRWKHAMHLLRLLMTGAATLRDARVPVRVEAHRERLLAVKRAELPWA